jgi:mono/diheme cytochrome c family protein
LRSAAKSLLAGLLSLLLLPGCGGETYPEDLVYPVRPDPLSVKRPATDAPDIDRPGEFPNVLFAHLPAELREPLLLSPAKMTAEQRNQLKLTLENMFGTPAQPKVAGVSDEVRTLLALGESTLAVGSMHYRHHCLHCHGLSGDGRGSTAPWINPHPRDYRQGVFKFTSSGQEEGKRKPRREDILRTIREGIDGSKMPPFRESIAGNDIDAVVSYVIHLSLRGETEFAVIRAIFRVDDELPGGESNPIEAKAQEWLGELAERWKTAQASLITPDSTPSYKNEEERLQSVRRGFELFTKQGEAGCISCHTDFGRQSAYKYDVWGTIVKPADLTQSIYRGGRRPLDLFWRIHSGINGTGMTSFGKRKPNDASGLTASQIWDLVNFVQVLPYKEMRTKFGIKLEAN